jgi:hypothetical protein
MRVRSLADSGGVDTRRAPGRRWGAHEIHKKSTMKNVKSFSHHRGKDEIRQNAEAQFWNGLISEFAHRVKINVLELISEAIRHLCRKKKIRIPDFIGD